MKNERSIGYILIAIGIIALLVRMTSGAGWFWVGLVAAAAFVAYAYRKSYGFLVLGGILGGVALGILLEGWGWNGAFLICLGVGFLAIDRIEPRKSHWPVYVAVILVILGFITTLSSTGILGSFWFALILIAIGVYLLYRRQARGGEDGGWVRVGPRTPPVGPESSSASNAVPLVPEPVVSSTSGPSQPTDQSSQPRPRAPSQAAPKAPVPKASTARRPAAETPPEPPETVEPEASVALSEDAAERYGRLATWRKEEAATHNIRSFIVLPNATLEHIARDNPRTLAELDKIKGVGPVKLERYGEAILAVLRDERGGN